MVFYSTLFVEFIRSSFLFPGLNFKSKAHIFFLLKILCLVSCFHGNREYIQRACVYACSYPYMLVLLHLALKGSSKFASGGKAV